MAASHRLSPVVVLITVATAMLLALTVAIDAQGRGVPSSPGWVSAALGTIVTVCGAVVLQRYPRHRVGVVLVAFGFLWSIDGCLEAWSAYGAAELTPPFGTGFAHWFVARIGAFLLVGLPLLLTWYPDGHLPSGHRRPLAVAGLAMACVLPVALVLMPAEVVYAGSAFPPVAEPAIPSLPVSEATAVAILTAARLITFLAMVPALAIAFLRHRHAVGRERRQLRWLLWAAIICAMLVALSVLFPTSLIAYVTLFAAVVATSASVAIGITRPDILDIDALVASTVVYTGVAAAVVAIDLLALAAVDRFLGERLDQREVALLVLLVAVAAYGPLRSWLTGLVRRALVGRRGDRYRVVSELAARLETRSRLDDQLAELTSAVAETFRMGFVGVSIDASDGRTRSAAYGTRPAVVTEVPLSYAGVAVGRLTLPARGIGSMLSRRDRALLIDLVRQTAMAIRSATLAAQVQTSREQLVQDRENDRRRIRRDLHDGLGPALGGVAMRLDAAGNALTTDPERTATLIRQARTEVSDALADVRRLVHGLRPPALDDLGLAAAIEQHAEGARTSGLVVEVDVAELPRLGAAAEVAAYRIVAESLTNVVRHARAGRCRITLEVAHDVLVVEIADDGVGIGPEVSAGVGLHSIRERCAELGGHCTVTCPDTGGTVVHARLPLLEGECG